MALCLALLGGVPACRGNAKLRKEAAVMLQAIELLQAAPPESRRKLLDALEQTPAEGQAAKRARDQCVAAYRALDAATGAAAQLPEGGLPEALDRDARELLTTLKRADEQLKEANRLLPECRQATADLRKLVR